MARVTRADIFDPGEIAIVHCVSRVVRRCFLLGDDPFSGKNFDHRKVWIETELKRLAANMGIDLLAFSLLSNHFHLVLRSRPDVVSHWEDTEIARRWLRLCPVRKSADGSPEEPTEPELNTIRNAPARLQAIRRRLSDISWWMRLLCQKIAQRANREDEAEGKFFQGRYRAVRLLDEEAVLACSAYVDLNPIRAAMAQTLETSDYTSVQRRIESLQASLIPDEASYDAPASQASALQSTATGVATSRHTQSNDFLSPIEIDELLDPTGPSASRTETRASDKGFLPMPTAAYIELLDWTARQLAPGKRGSTPDSAPAIFERLRIRPKVWCELVTDFGQLFSLVAGQPHRIDEHRSRAGRRFHMRRRARELATH